MDLRPSSGDPPKGLRSALPLIFIILFAAILRFTGLAWGAPYYHFHIDEHFVFAGADMLRRSLREAALSPKFFMYGPLTMWMLDAVVFVWERVSHPLVLSVPRDEVTYMVLGRAISATFGTAGVLVVYRIADRLAGRTAGLLAALLLAASVVHLRESHFFSVDLTMLFFALLTWLLAIRIADRGRTIDYAWAGVTLGLALACKYTALFLLPVLALAHVCAPTRPRTFGGSGTWGRWIGIGILPLTVAAALFMAIDPMVLLYFTKFKDDVTYWVVGPNSGRWRPIFIAQFADVEPYGYWFTNILWWGLGPALEIAGLAGVAWLVFRRDRASLVAAAFPIAYYIAVSQGIAPYARYGAPLAPALAVAAAVLFSDLMARPRARTLGIVIATVVCGVTSLYAAAYLHVFSAPDSRLAASRWLLGHVPADSRILVEPSHNIPPTGSYLTNVDFNRDYVLWRGAERHDYYRLSSLDAYQYLFDPRTTDDARRQYIEGRLAGADWIVIDDTFLQFYQHLPDSEYGVMKQYYRDLMSGRLGFELVKTFKVYPSLLGHQVNDDGAEMTFRLFDHPRVFIFKRRTAQ